MVGRRVRCGFGHALKGTLFLDGLNAAPATCQRFHHAAMVLAMAATAGRQIRFRARRKQGRDQHPAEQRDLRSCSNPAHHAGSRL
jgi:hypothetical protein